MLKPHVVNFFKEILMKVMRCLRSLVVKPNLFMFEYCCIMIEVV